MRYSLLRFVVLSVLISLLTGCILSRSVDRAFIGFERPPKYQDHKTTGAILIPIAMAADLVTLPIQAVLLMIYGDDYPFEEDRYATDLEYDPRFQKMSDQQKSTARAGLGKLLQPGAAADSHGLVLCEDGHWVEVSLPSGAREKLIARAYAAAPGLALAKAH